MVKQIRRVVTAQNSDGKSEFIIDEMASSVKEMESMFCCPGEVEEREGELLSSKRRESD